MGRLIGVGGKGLGRAVWGISGAALALVGRLLGESPGIVEWHRKVAYPRIEGFLQPLSRGFESTIGELIVLLGIGLCAPLLIRFKGAAIAVIAFSAGLIVLGFYLTWGVAYSYPALSDRLPPLAEAPEGEAPSHRLSAITERAAALLSRMATAMPGDTEITETDHTRLLRVNAGLRAGWDRLPAAIEAAPVSALAFGPAKFSRVSFALSRLQLSGYYFPWTGEAQINAEMPRTLWARVAAHEQAHQRGFARENEATVIGLLICLISPEASVKYSGALGLFAALDRELLRVDKTNRERIVAELPRRVLQDFARESEFWSKHDGAAGRVSERVNDTYLKAQGVESGIASYSDTTRLLLQVVETRGLGLGFLRASGESAELR